MYFKISQATLQLAANMNGSLTIGEKKNDPWIIPKKLSEHILVCPCTLYDVLINLDSSKGTFKEHSQRYNIP